MRETQWGFLLRETQRGCLLRETQRGCGVKRPYKTYDLQLQNRSASHPDTHPVIPGV